jgi:Family of unknown function (DUF5681)
MTLIFEDSFQPVWKKGQSGNPAGKPPGIHSRHATQVKELIASRLPELVEKAIGMALDGDSAALKICLERVCPPMRPRDDAVTLDMPKGETLANLGRRILEGMGNSSLTPDQAYRLLQSLQALSSIESADQFEARIAALETAVLGRKSTS